MTAALLDLQFLVLPYSMLYLVLDRWLRLIKFLVVVVLAAAAADTVACAAAVRARHVRHRVVSAVVGLESQEGCCRFAFRFAYSPSRSLRRLSKLHHRHRRSLRNDDVDLNSS